MHKGKFLKLKFILLCIKNEKYSPGQAALSYYKILLLSRFKIRADTNFKLCVLALVL
jgi:hypothetical protein